MKTIKTIFLFMSIVVCFSKHTLADNSIPQSGADIFKLKEALTKRCYEKFALYRGDDKAEAIDNCVKKLDIIIANSRSEVEASLAGCNGVVQIFPDPDRWHHQCFFKMLRTSHNNHLRSLLDAIYAYIEFYLRMSKSPTDTTGLVFAYNFDIFSFYAIFETFTKIISFFNSTHYSQTSLIFDFPFYLGGTLLGSGHGPDIRKLKELEALIKKITPGVLREAEAISENLLESLLNAIANSSAHSYVRTFDCNKTSNMQAPHQIEEWGYTFLVSKLYVNCIQLDK